MLTIVGLGPAGRDQMSLQALEAIDQADLVVGYTTYIKLIEDLLEGKEVISNGMHKEEDRCRTAVDEAGKGRKVAIVSSGDAGVYGMAGLVYEVLGQRPDLQGKLEVRVVPGITASLAAAAVLGAPLMHDFCQISLSDWLTPKETIKKRLEAAAQADFVICLYNPRSKHRPDHLGQALDIIRSYRDPGTPVGMVKGAGRVQEEVRIDRLDSVDEEFADMQTMVIIGNSNTFIEGGKMITPRGYKL